jgi:protein-S-isoprenylcysteine O-methyltransferase Ste14
MHVLVFMQLALGAILALPYRPPAWSVTGLVVTGLGIVALIWVIAYNRFGNWRMDPRPRDRARLITTGPYRIVRHPMYLASLLICAGIAITHNHWPNYAALAGFTLVVVVKARVEERHLVGQFGEAYRDYRRRVKGLVPGVW